MHTTIKTSFNDYTTTARFSTSKSLHNINSPQAAKLHQCIYSKYLAKSGCAMDGRIVILMDGLSTMDDPSVIWKQKIGILTKLQVRVLLEGCWGHIHWRMNVWYQLSQVYLVKTLCHCCLTILQHL